MKQTNEKTVTTSEVAMVLGVSEAEVEKKPLKKGGYQRMICVFGEIFFMKLKNNMLREYHIL